ncbi:hypothetical protein ACIHFC_28540 [Streptomyces sp. NPDC052013]|uniref:hypothetical protein n=1 Tax=Streptomyces sp. NPDC052013 TaxID=3365679 RepID=UPI0037D04096
MRTTNSSPAATSGRAVARAVKALLSLLVLAVAVGGLPLLLVWATPVIWAATHDDVLHLLDRQDTGGVFLLLLACVGWIGWAQFTFCAVRELIAQMRGRTWIVLGAGALLAAAITGALALRRTLQRRRRKPGEKIAITSQTFPAEAQLAATAEPGGAARLDVALRTLAHHLAQQDENTVLPPLRAARIESRSVQVLPEDLTQEPVAPFAAGQDGWWVLPIDAALLDEEAAREVPAPYPGLVTIGSTEAGDLMLLNLAQLPALLLDGNPSRPCSPEATAK